MSSVHRIIGCGSENALVDPPRDRNGEHRALATDNALSQRISYDPEKKWHSNEGKKATDHRADNDPYHSSSDSDTNGICEIEQNHEGDEKGNRVEKAERQRRLSEPPRHEEAGTKGRRTDFKGVLASMHAQVLSACA